MMFIHYQPIICSKPLWIIDDIDAYEDFSNYLGCSPCADDRSWSHRVCQSLWRQGAASASTFGFRLDAQSEGNRGNILSSGFWHHIDVICSPVLRVHWSCHCIQTNKQNTWSHYVTFLYFCRNNTFFGGERTGVQVHPLSIVDWYRFRRGMRRMTKRRVANLLAYRRRGD